MTFETFKMGEEGRLADKIDRLLATPFPEETAEKIEAIDDRFRAVAVAETWCPDCVVNIVVLEKLARQIDLTYTLMTKEEAGDRFADYHVDGVLKIPTILFYRGDELLGAFVERPEIEDFDRDQYLKGAYFGETLSAYLSILTSR
jgi:hypothetical protein